MRSVRLKFLIIYVLVILLIFVIFNLAGSRMIRKELETSRKDLMYSEAELIEQSYMENYYQEQMTPGYLRAQLRTIDTFLDLRIWIVDANRRLIIDTRSNVMEEGGAEVPELTEELLSSRCSDHVMIPGYLTQECISAVLPVSYNYRVRGYIVIFSSYQSIENTVNQYMDVINVASLFLYGLLFVVFLVLDLEMEIPLHKINRRAGEYATGHFTEAKPLRTGDEFEDLSESVTLLGRRLQSMDEYQNRFISNVSHDFRSPLTSIKGYAQAMLDGTIPPEMQEKYLNIILFEADRLTKLTSNLLEMNRMSGEKTLQWSNFDIIPVILQTAATFEGTCEKKKISFRMVFEENEMFVDADLGKIQQVVYNLIDNAIKFSNNNSEIQIRAEEVRGKVLISVKDSGIGIPQESLSKIWDRFYKTDLSRGKDRKGTGLGLSIVKEIISAHGENISVTSTEGAGTEFVFSLKAGKAEDDGDE